MSRTTEPSSAADESASGRDDTTVDPTPPGGIARSDVNEVDDIFRVLDTTVVTDRVVAGPVLAPVPGAAPASGTTVEQPLVVADADPKRPIRSMLGTREMVQAISTLTVLVGVTLFTFVQLHPSRIFSSAVPTGGDMGAHVWAPAYLRDHLLPHGRVIGWSMDWYAGLPVYRFYMLPPALLILLLDVVMSYGMAFKIIAVLGVLTLPVCCWAFGRLSRFPHPIPALFAVAGTIFLFDETFTILGGNIASTMAGEFSFSIALSLAMLALGVFARGMENGEHRALAAILIALAALTHGIVVFFVALGVVVLFLIAADRRRLVYFLTTGITALALAAFWLAPFVLTSRYMTDMKYEGAPTPGGEWNSYWRMFFPHLTIVDQFWTILALVGFVAAVVRRHRVGAFMGVYSLLLVALVFLSKEGIPGFGLLWNVRLLPFLYLLRYMLAMVGIIEIAWFLVRSVRNARLARLVDTAGPNLPIGAIYVRGARPRDVSRRKLLASVLTLGLVSVVSVGWLSWHLGKFPGQKEVYRAEGQTDSEKYRFEWFGMDVATSNKNGFVDGWADWNFKGWVGKPAYGEYRALMETMKQIGADPEHGCGRALWEEPNGGEYGTPMALMLLPFWTDSCIGSMEGLYFEASATTPYNFLARAAMSEEASNPVRGLAYENKSAEVGVRYLQTLGARYYLAWTPQAVGRAAEQPELIEIAVSGPWHIYEVAGSDLVTPLANEPVVVRERDGDQRERWLEVGASWFQHPEAWNAIPVADGPDSWQRVSVAPDELLPHPRVDVVRPTAEIEARPLDEVQVSDVRLGNESMSFTVDQIGVPVLVKVSYFPNWEVSGADGPYRVAPNMMVVIPTENEVKLSYGLTVIDYASYAITLLGVIGLFVLWRRGRVVYADRLDPWAAYPSDADPFAPDRPYTYEAVAPVVPVQEPSFDLFDFDDIELDRPVEGTAQAPALDDDFDAWAFGVETATVVERDGTADAVVTERGDAPERDVVTEHGDTADSDATDSNASMSETTASDESASDESASDAPASDVIKAGPADRPVASVPIPPAPYVPPAPIDPATGWAVPSGRPLPEPPGSQFWLDDTPEGTIGLGETQPDEGKTDIDSDGR
ncbi:MAG: hypothetical protein AB7Q42_00040 [Acidimicrobiia bacterium]